MSFQKGMQKLGGRKVGVPNKRSQLIYEIAEKIGIDPFEVLLHVAQGNETALCLGPRELTHFPDGRVIAEPWITPEMRLAAAKEACQYMYPKLRSVEHTGTIDASIEAGPITREQLIAAIKKDPAMNLNLVEIENESGG